MSLAITELSKARDTVAGLLDELALDAYLFEVEPRDDEWEVRIECAMAQGWQTVNVSVDKAMLLASMDEPNVRRQLIADWQVRLRACKLRPS